MAWSQHYTQLEVTHLTRNCDNEMADKHCPPLAVSVISPSGQAVVKSLQVLGYIATLIGTLSLDVCSR